MNVTMYGPAFDDSGLMVERQVPQSDVSAFRNAGYQVGSLPEELKPVAEEKETKAPKKGKG